MQTLVSYWFFTLIGKFFFKELAFLMIYKLDMTYTHQCFKIYTTKYNL